MRFSYMFIHPWKTTKLSLNMLIQHSWIIPMEQKPIKTKFLRIFLKNSNNKTLNSRSLNQQKERRRFVTSRGDDFLSNSMIQHTKNPSFWWRNEEFMMKNTRVGNATAKGERRESCAIFSKFIKWSKSLTKLWSCCISTIGSNSA